MSYKLDPAPINDPIDKNTGIFSGVWKSWFQNVYKAFVDIATRLTTLEAAAVQNVVTGSRALGTAYQNTTGKRMRVEVSAHTSIAATPMYFYTDAANPPTTVVKRFDEPAANYPISIGHDVLPGNYYKVDFTAGVKVLDCWTETY